MSIQQSLNQMLMSAQVGAGLYKQTPEAKARAELKATEKREATETLAHERTLADYEEAHKYLAPDELPGSEETERKEAEKAAQGLYDIAQAQYLRNPTQENWEKRYTTGVNVDEIKKQGGTAAYIAKLKKNLQERQESLQDYETQPKARRSIISDQHEKLMEVKKDGK